MPDAGKDFFKLLNQIDMPEPAEDNFQSDEENDHDGYQDNDFMKSRLAILILKKRIDICMHQGTDNIELEYEREAKYKH